MYSLDELISSDEDDSSELELFSNDDELSSEEDDTPEELDWLDDDFIALYFFKYSKQFL